MGGTLQVKNNKIFNYIKNNENKVTILDLSNHFNIEPSIVIKNVKENGYNEYIDDYKNYSLPELEFKNILLKNNIVENVDYCTHHKQLIQPYEIDFYFPMENLAIEISPNFTHDMKTSKANYHYEKFKLCEKLGIRLITLFDFLNKEVVYKKVINEVLLSYNWETLKSFKRNNSMTNYKDFITKYSIKKYENVDYHCIECRNTKGKLISLVLIGNEAKAKIQIADIVYKTNISNENISEILQNIFSEYEKVVEFIVDNSTGLNAIFENNCFQKVKTLPPETIKDGKNRIEDCGYTIYQLLRNEEE